jgi:hypothetical protein
MPSLPPGVYEHVITRALDEALLQLGDGASERSPQELDWLDDALARYVAGKLHRTLEGFGRQDDSVQRRADLVAELLEVLARHEGPVELPGDHPLPSREALTWVAPRDRSLARPVPPARPEHGLVHPSLLFNGHQQVSLFHELEREFASADTVDALIAFLRFSGFKLLEPAMRRFVERGGKLRVVCSTYTGATEARAVRELVALGAKVRVAYEEDGTRLHAKAWLFRRASGLSTAYIGSSNLSRSAMTDGSEWKF